jgi:hypothetical protein
MCIGGTEFCIRIWKPGGGGEKVSLVLSMNLNGGLKYVHLKKYKSFLRCQIDCGRMLTVEIWA